MSAGTGLNLRRLTRGRAEHSQSKRSACLQCTNALQLPVLHFLLCTAQLPLRSDLAACCVPAGATVLSTGSLPPKRTQRLALTKVRMIAAWWCARAPHTPSPHARHQSDGLKRALEGLDRLPARSSRPPPLRFLLVACSLAQQHSAKAKKICSRNSTLSRLRRLSPSPSSRSACTASPKPTVSPACAKMQACAWKPRSLPPLAALAASADLLSHC